MIYVNSITGVNTFEIEQGTEEWLRHRAGSITASRSHDIIKSGRGKGGYSEARKTYMIELIAQVCTGLMPDSVKFKQAEYGHEHEPLARSAYEAQKFEIVETCGLIYKDESMRCAVSPDGLTDIKGLEIKCPFTTAVHIDTLMNGIIKPEYHTQMQYCMWVTGYKGWDFCSFDPRMRGGVENRLFIQEFLPDNELFDKFEVEIPKFIAEMDEALDKLGFTFGDQWRVL
ncbi:MAG: lambda exonuclease family protein [Aeromonas veronii]